MRQRGNREAADGATQELFILIKLDDVVGGSRLGKKIAPRFVLVVFTHNELNPLKLICCKCSLARVLAKRRPLPPVDSGVAYSPRELSLDDGVTHLMACGPLDYMGQPLQTPAQSVGKR